MMKKVFGVHGFCMKVVRARSSNSLSLGSIGERALQHFHGWLCLISNGFRLFAGKSIHMCFVGECRGSLFGRAIAISPEDKTF